MSRVAKMPIEVPQDVQVQISGQVVNVKGGKGALTHRVHDLVTVRMDKSTITVTSNSESKQSKAPYPMRRAA